MYTHTCKHAHTTVNYYFHHFTLSQLPPHASKQNLIISWASVPSSGSRASVSIHIHSTSIQSLDKNIFMYHERFIARAK